MKLVIKQEEINKISLDELAKRFPYQNRHHVQDPIGQEFHKLYAYISTQFNGIKIADIGTRTGNSAIALSYNENNRVDSYDVHKPYYDIVCENIKKENISFYLENILTDPKILQYELISLDVDPHDSIQESKCFDYLIANNYSGLVLLDDINFARVYPALRQWWNSIELPKWDLTKYGHQSGTGLVDFTGKLEVVLDVI